MIAPLKVHKYNLATFFVWLMGALFLSSSLMKAVNVYSFAQTINSFCGLLGLDGFYGYGVLLAILICTIECLLPLLSMSNNRYKGIVVWCYPVILGYFTYITFINYTDLYGGIESCGCFGEIIHLSPAASFYKNIVLLVLSLLLLVSHLMDQYKASKPLLPSISIDGYLFVGLLASSVPPLFSFLCLNKMSHAIYLSLFIIFCIVSIVGCVLFAIRKPS